MSVLDMIGDCLPDCALKPITRENHDEAAEVFLSNDAFFIENEGEPASLESIAGCVDAAPPSFDKVNKLFTGVWRDGEMAAVFDILLGYPRTDCLYIGLLLIRADLQGNGLGGAIVDALFKMARERGLNAAQLGVIDTNERGLAFWRSRGFEAIGESSAARDDGRALKIIVMERKL